MIVAQSVDLHPAEWADVVRSIGLGGAVVLIIVLSLGTAFVVRGPGILNSFNRILDTYLKHQRETIRIKDKIRTNQEKLALALEDRKGKNNRSGGGSGT
jgi:hypothetical protein